MSVWNVDAQCPNNGQNPNTAYVFHSNQTFVQLSVPICVGQQIPVPKSICPSPTYTDKNPYYYRMHCYQSSQLIFQIIPFNISDDYDWQLFDITGKNPNDIYTDTSLFVRCNWSGNVGVTGTSINATSLNGCEGSSSPLFTIPPYLFQGHDYLLMISHFDDAGQSGYNLRFFGDSATTIATTPLPQIKGQIYLDHNSNSIKDTLEPYKANVKVQLSNGNFTFTDNNGFYQIQADSIGAYTLTVTPPNLYNAVPQIINYNFTSWDTVVTKDIALQPTVVKDSVYINVLPMVMNAVQGGAMPYYVSYDNAGTTLLSPLVSLTYNNYLLAYDSCTDATAVATANGIITGEPNMQPGKRNDFVSYFTVKPSANIGDTLTTVFSITSPNASQSDSIYMIVEGGTPSPDAQRATPSLTDVQVAAGKEIVYSIGFKNTGNDTAYNVVITDTLSNLLQANTLQMIASSHPCKTTVKGNLVTFELLNIKLPKASSNALKSIGFVSFKIKPKNNLTAGTIITNKANTYYNYRAPQSSIATTVIKTVVTPLKMMNYELRMVNDKHVENTWITSNEVNVSLFNMQRSINNKDFINIGKVVANNKIYNEYRFVDNISNVELGINNLYYRIESVDFDGKKQYSETKTINYKPQTINGVNIYPNPAKDVVTVETKGAKALQIIDYLGRIIIDDKTINNQSTIINVQGFVKGVYVVKMVLNNNITLFEKFIKQ